MRYDAAVAEGARVTEGVRIEGVIVYTVLVVTMTVYCMRCFMSRKAVALVEVTDIGTQTVTDKEEIMDQTIEAIRGHLRRRGGLRACVCADGAGGGADARTAMR